MTKINYFANDPLDSVGLRKTEAPRSIKKPKFTIVDWDGIKGSYQPGQIEFQGNQLNYIIIKTINTMNAFFETDFKNWSTGKSTLKIYPRAGYDWNAFYTRDPFHLLAFYLEEDIANNNIMFTCESPDIVSHELGHAILDIYHPELWDLPHIELGAFHESFGDCCAILTTLQNKKVRENAIKEIGKEGKKDNLVSLLAEEFGKALHDKFGRHAAPPNCLRNANNNFKYVDPTTLSDEGPEQKLTAEIHSFSRVFTGAFWDIIIELYKKYTSSIKKELALLKAGNKAGFLLAGALEIAPSGKLFFADIAKYMIFVNRKKFDSEDEDLLFANFRKRKILKSTSLKIDEKTLTKIPKFSRKIGAKIPKSALRTIGVESFETLNVQQSIKKRTGEKITSLDATILVKLPSKTLGSLKGLYVKIPSGITIHEKPGLKSMFSNYHRISKKEINIAQKNVLKLKKANKIHSYQLGLEIDMKELLRHGKSHYVTKDSKGKLILRRTGFA